MKIRILSLLVAFVLSAVAQAQFNANLVRNGSAESFTGPEDGIVDFADWTRSGNVYVNLYSSYPLTYLGAKPTGQGTHYFLGGSPAGTTQGVTTSLSQNVDLGFAASTTDSGRSRFDLSAWFNVRNQDEGAGPEDAVALRVQFFGPASNLLGTSTLGSFDGNRYQGNSALVDVSVGFFESLSGIVPVGARSATVTQLYTRRNGTILNTGMDLVSLQVQAVPEPAAVLALGAGALTLIHRRIRTR